MWNEKKESRLEATKCFAEEDHYTVWNDLVTATVIVKERAKDRYNISSIWFRCAGLKWIILRFHIYQNFI